MAALCRADEADISVGGPETMTRGEIADLAIETAGTAARIVHVPPPLLYAVAKVLRPVHPRMAEVLDFVTRACTNDFVASAVGTRRLRNHFAALSTSAPR